jgi:hypothetical protein
MLTTLIAIGMNLFKNMHTKLFRLCTVAALFCQSPCAGATPRIITLSNQYESDIQLLSLQVNSPDYRNSKFYFLGNVLKGEVITFTLSEDIYNSLSGFEGYVNGDRTSLHAKPPPDLRFRSFTLVAGENHFVVSFGSESRLNQCKAPKQATRLVAPLMNVYLGDLFFDKFPSGLTANQRNERLARLGLPTLPIDGWQHHAIGTQAAHGVGYLHGWLAASVCGLGGFKESAFTTPQAICRDVDPSITKDQVDDLVWADFERGHRDGLKKLEKP